MKREEAPTLEEYTAAMAKTQQNARYIMGQLKQKMEDIRRSPPDGTQVVIEFRNGKATVVERSSTTDEEAEMSHDSTTNIDELNF